MGIAAAKLANGQVLDDAFLGFIEAVMLQVERFLELLQLDQVLSGLLRPRQ